MISIFQNHLGVYKDVVGNGGNMVLLIPSVVSIFREQIMRGAIAVTFTLVWDILSVLSDCRLEKKTAET